MRFGWCVAPEMLEAAARAGCDFVELPASLLQPERPESEIASVRETLRGSAARPEVWQVSLPSGVALVGHGIDWARIARYVHTAFRRASLAGGSVMVVRCGEGERVPVGFSRRQTMDQLIAFLRMCGAVARNQGLSVAVEPLSPACGDLVTSVPEAIELARQVEMPNVGVAPNVATMLAGGQSLFDIADAASWLAHVRISTGELRTMDRRGDGLTQLTEALRLADYDWRLSVEPGPGPEGKEPGLTEALEILKRCMGGARRGT